MLDSYRHLLKIKGRGVIAESLRQVGLTDFSGALMGTLSGGQSQKILIARALMGTPISSYWTSLRRASTPAARRISTG